MTVVVATPVLDAFPVVISVYPREAKASFNSPASPGMPVPFSTSIFTSDLLTAAGVALGSGVLVFMSERPWTIGVDEGVSMGSPDCLKTLKIKNPPTANIMSTPTMAIIHFGKPPFCFAACEGKPTWD